MPEPTKIQTSKVFVFDNGAVSTAENTGGFAFNTDVLNTAGPRPRVETAEILSDGPSAVVSGVEQGAGKAITTFPSTAGIAGRVAPGAGYIGLVSDTAHVGQHVMQGNAAEAVTEGMGVAGAAGGAWIGAKGMAVMGTLLLGPGLGTVGGAFVGGLAGAFVGGQGMKSLGESLTGGDTPDKFGPPQTLPADTPLEPTVTTANGDRYALVQVDGKYTWFAMLDNSNLNLASPYIEVVSGAKMAELTGTYLNATDYPAQLAHAAATVGQLNVQHGLSPSGYGHALLTGAAAQTIAAAQLNPSTGNANNATRSTDEVLPSRPMNDDRYLRVA